MRMDWAIFFKPARGEAAGGPLGLLRFDPGPGDGSPGGSPEGSALWAATTWVI
jgi:hypothetical protein